LEAREGSDVIHAAHSSALFADTRRAGALERWRDSADVVAIRWRDYLAAAPGAGRLAFAIYVAALDAEEAAAADLAALSSRGAV
jgi:hypothetical protein